MVVRAPVRALSVPGSGNGQRLQPAPAREGLRVDLLGPLRVRVGDSPVQVAGPRRRALLALMAMTAPRPVPVDRIISVLCDESVGTPTVPTVRTYVSKLRKELGAAAGQLRTADGGYLLDLDDNALDVRRFHTLLASARDQLALRRRLEIVDEALALWRGDPLVEVRTTAWGRSEARALGDAWMDAVVLRATTRLALGDHRAVAAELTPLLDEHPQREDLAAVLLVSLYRSGRQADALMLYPLLRDRLVDELGIEPGPTLSNVHAAILRHDPGLDIPTRRAVRLRTDVAPTPAQVTGDEPSALTTEDLDSAIATIGTLAVEIGSANDRWRTLALHARHVLLRGALTDAERVVDGVVAEASRMPALMDESAEVSVAAGAGGPLPAQREA